jgi:hypothetical protein
MAITYFVTVTFERDGEGNLVPGEALEAPNAEIARRRAAELSDIYSGAVAFARTGDPATGKFEDAEVLAQFGDVDREALRR